MNEDSLGPEAGSLMRARLHIRGGRRRCRQGKISACIVTFYDAILSALKWYLASPDRRKGLTVYSGEDLTDDRTAYAILTRSGVLDGRFDYAAFDRLVDRAAYEELPGYDVAETLAGIETVMTQLGVMPFDEKDLPPEDPATF